MARYTGPRRKVMRSLGVDLPGLSRKSIGERNYPPGQAGPKRKPRRSDYALELSEKQKLRYNYGLTERQMRNAMAAALRYKGNTGEKLLEMLERRLDNAVFRAGFAPTLVAARQLVSHRHVLLNGRITTIPSLKVNPGDQIALKDDALKMEMVVDALANLPLDRPEWIAFDETEKRARVARMPAADEVPLPIEIKRVVAYYSDRL
jgi:small subunit ribosomal protein S4